VIDSPVGEEESVCSGKVLESTDSPMKDKLKCLLSQYPDVISPELGVTSFMTYDIELVDSTPIRSHPYCLSPPKAVLMKKHIQSLLDKGVIEVSKSNWSSPAFLVPKRDGTERRLP
jgi:hypothetical protein